MYDNQSLEGYILNFIIQSGYIFLKCGYNLIFDITKIKSTIYQVFIIKIIPVTELQKTRINIER